MSEVEKKLYEYGVLGIAVLVLGAAIVWVYRDAKSGADEQIALVRTLLAEQTAISSDARSLQHDLQSMLNHELEQNRKRTSLVKRFEDRLQKANQFDVITTNAAIDVLNRISAQLGIQGFPVHTTPEMLKDIMEVKE